MADYPEELYSGEPPHRGVDTSVAAAQSMLEAATTLQSKVYRAVRSRGVDGMTDEEIQSALSLRIPTEVARRRELVLLGVLEDTKRRRPNASGRDAIVWRVVRQEAQVPLFEPSGGGGVVN